MSELEAQQAPAPVTPANASADDTITSTERQWIIASLGSALVLAIILFGAYRMG